MELLGRVVERVLQAVLFVGVIGAVICLVKGQWLAAAGFVGLTGAMLFVFFHVRCPRCREPIGADIVGNKDWGRDRDKGVSPTAGECSGCGRTRDGVLPFQYLFAPEPDEG